MLRRRLRDTSWQRLMDLSSGRVVRLEWHPLKRLAVTGETLVNAPRGIVRVDGELTDGEAWEIRQRLREDKFFG